MLALDGDQLAPPQRPGIAEQKQGVVAGAGEATVAAGDQAANLHRRLCRGLPRRGTVLAENAGQGMADRQVAGLPGVTGQGVRLADR